MEWEKEVPSTRATRPLAGVPGFPHRTAGERRFRNGGEIYYFQHSSYFVHQTHTLKTHSSHLRHQNPETLRVPRRYKKHHNNQINIYKTRLQCCLAAWHIHYLTCTTCNINYLWLKAGNLSIILLTEGCSSTISLCLREKVWSIICVMKSRVLFLISSSRAFLPASRVVAS